mgnify:CR=1 FL=1
MKKLPSELAAEWIRIERLRLGFSQTELATVLAVDRSLVSRLENGRVRLTVDDLAALAKIFGTLPPGFL